MHFFHMLFIISHMIEIKELTKKYGDKKVIDNIDFQVQDGEILGFLGPNGAGKTTTMRMITGFLAPTKGTITINGKDILEDSVDMRRSIGYLPENNPLYSDMRVYESLQFVAGARRIADKQRSLSHVIDVCKLRDVLTQPIGELSKGYKQRVGLAQALIGDPDILILDEPTSGLDPNQASEVRKLIKNIGQKKTIIFSTHILQEATAVCHRALIIHKGKIVAQGTPDELIAKTSSKQKISAIIEGPEQEILNTLRTLPHVSDVSLQHLPTANEAEFSIQINEHHDLRKNIFQMAKQHNWVLLEMRRSQANLETVFHELTQ